MSRRTEKNVGIIGLGIIGQRVAESVRRRGYHVFVWNRTPRPFPNFVGSPSEIAELCDFIQIFVSDDEALIAMVQQLKPSLKAHHVVMAHSTVAPHTMRAAAEIVQRRGAQLLDAPFTGSKGAAEKGELVYYIGGDDAAYKRARPVLQASSKEIIEIGEIGQATTIKVATNMITAATVQVAAEALAVVHGAGLPLEKFASAMRGNGSNSGTLTMKLPKMMTGDFEPHFSVKHMLKDVQIASRMARSQGVPVPATETARDGLLEEVRRGRGDADYSSVVQNFFPDGVPTKSSIAEVRPSEEQASFSDLEHQEPDAPMIEAEPIAQKVEVEEPEEVTLKETVAEESRIEEAEKPLVEPDEPQKLPETETAVSLNGSAPDEPETEVTTEPAREIDPVEATAPVVVEVPEETKPAVAEKAPEEPRGFLSRLFGKGVDY